MLHKAHAISGIQLRNMIASPHSEHKPLSSAHAHKERSSLYLQASMIMVHRLDFSSNNTESKVGLPLTFMISRIVVSMPMAMGRVGWGNGGSLAQEVYNVVCENIQLVQSSLRVFCAESTHPPTSLWMNSCPGFDQHLKGTNGLIDFEGLHGLIDTLNVDMFPGKMSRCVLRFLSSPLG